MNEKTLRRLDAIVDRLERQHVITIERVQHLQVAASDIVVLCSPTRLPHDAALRLKLMWEKYAGCRAVVMDAGLHVQSVLRATNDPPCADGDSI